MRHQPDGGPLDPHHLIESLEAISDGFALFDRDERLVLVNEKFRRLFGRTAPFMVPGVTYEELLRLAVREGENPDAVGRDPEGYVQERLALFRRPRDPFEFQTDDGRWILVADYKTVDGGTVCIRTDISELKRRIAEAQESEARYRQLVDLSPDGIAVHEESGRGRFLNASGRRILGIPEGESVSGLAVMQFATPEAMPLAEALMRRVCQTGEQIHAVRLPIRRPDGTVFTAEVSALPFVSGGERLVLVLFRDVSEEAAAALRLRESEARARSILETALDAIVSIDADGHILEFNPAAERTFGWRRHEVLGRQVGDVLVPAHHRRAHMTGMDRFQRSGESVMIGRRVEIEAVRKDGTVFPVELAITEVPLGPGRRFTAYIRDITEQKRVQQEVDEKTRILETMMDSVGVGIEVYDAQGRLLIANRRLAELLDLPDELLMPGIRDVDVLRYLAEHGEYPDETVEESLTDYEEIREGEGYYNERRRPNGRWLQVRHFPMPGGGYVALFTDVTEQKNLEAQLLQSQKMDALGQLAGGVAHDFNNILSVVGGYASMAGSMVEAGSPLQGYLQKITQGVQRAAALTRELLTFSRRKAVQARTIDLVQVIKGQEFLLGPLLGETIKLTMRVPDEPLWVSIDPDMAAQTLVNLAINARDAMPGGGPLAVVLERSTDRLARPPGLEAGDYAVLSVADGGTGMSEEVKQRIFEPFFTTKPPGQGTGLGLSMVYGTVRQAGGACEVDSAPGFGTTIRLWLPLAQAPHGQCAPAPYARPVGVVGPATILVAEDEPDLLELVRDTLRSAGYTVRTASDGVEALEVFEEDESIDLLLTDLVMPQLGGARLAQLVTQIRPDVRVLFMTGYPSRGQYAPADLPANATILYKPIDLGHLRSVVASALAGAAPEPGPQS